MNPRHPRHFSAPRSVFGWTPKTWQRMRVCGCMCARACASRAHSHVTSRNYKGRGGQVGTTSVCRGWGGEGVTRVPVQLRLGLTREPHARARSTGKHPVTWVRPCPPLFQPTLRHTHTPRVGESPSRSLGYGRDCHVTRWEASKNGCVQKKTHIRRVRACTPCLTYVE